MEGIKTKDLAIGYDKTLIDDISLNVVPGKIMTIIGPNGCGKSTLLKTLTGELKKKYGSVYLGGKDMDEISENEAAKQMAEVITKRIDPELMTCLEVVEMGRYPYTGRFGILSKEDKEIAFSALDTVNAADLKDRDFTQISDGQRQRVMLARAICQEPKVLVLDEPTSYLDIKHRIEIMSCIKRLATEKNVAVIMSLHELESAMRISDYVVALGEGKILRYGSAEEVFKESFIRKLFDIEGADLSLAGGRPWIEEDKAVHLTNIKPVPAEKSETCARIMIQGTMSNVGKSVIAAGLCRIFTKDGYRVSPFKSQNMALNSYITKDGLEMGRAQVMQAECCQKEPESDMNPVLLKPTSDVGSQVIVNGKPVGNMKAREYYSYKTKLIPDIKAAFTRLSKENDIIVIEGAGSPAEINLKENDIVNMGLAKMVDAPVLIVGDINPGGVFAQLKGTLDLLEDDEKDRVKGFIINQFRGDVSLLKPGTDELTKRTGKEVLGVIPYLDIDLEDEDSLSKRFEKGGKGLIDIAVIRLPHISNFTDFNIFSQVPKISVRYVSKANELEGADMIVLPGTKSTISDLRWLKENGLDKAVKKAAGKGCVIFGICGGFQMLGLLVEDPEGIEGTDENGGSKEEGLGLLDIKTVMTSEKIRKQFVGKIEDASGVLKDLTGNKISGYEIHMGITKKAGPLRAFTSDDTGYCKENIYGTYIHGIFDERQIAKCVIESLCKRAGKKIDINELLNYHEYKEMQYDKLEKALRESLDIEKIYRIMGIK